MPLQNNLAVEDVLELFQASGSLKIADAEHTALVRVFGGVAWASQQEWVSMYVL